MIYCVIPRELESELFQRMTDYYSDNPNVEVSLDRRESAEALRHGTQLYIVGPVAARRNCAHVTPQDEC